MNNLSKPQVSIKYCVFFIKIWVENEKSYGLVSCIYNVELYYMLYMSMLFVKVVLLVVQVMRSQICE